MAEYADITPAVAPDPEHVDKVPEFARPGAIVRIIYEGTVTAVGAGREHLELECGDGRRSVFMSAAIRPRIELVKEAPPAIPDEPTNIGAVVEITDGHGLELWVRAVPFGQTALAWTPARTYGEHSSWRVITKNKSVRVLSSGWSPGEARRQVGPAEATEEEGSGRTIAGPHVHPGGALRVLDVNGRMWERRSRYQPHWRDAYNMERQYRELHFPLTVLPDSEE